MLGCVASMIFFRIFPPAWVGRFCVAAAAVSLFAACTAKQESASQPVAKQEIKAEIFVSVRPLRMIVEAIAGDRWSVVEVLPSGASPHTYEPRPSDLKRALSGIAFLFVAPSLDGWASKIEHARRIEVLPFLPREARQEFHDPHHSLTPTLDPHFWTDPLAVKAILPNLTEALCGVDPDSCAQLLLGSVRFASELDALDREARSVLAGVKGSAVLLFHPSFLYMLKRYDLRLAGVIELSPGKEPSPRELKRLVEEVRRLKVKAVFSEPQFSKRPAEVIGESTGIPVAELEPYGLSTSQDYATFFRSNLQALAGALK